MRLLGITLIALALSACASLDEHGKHDLIAKLVNSGVYAGKKDCQKLTEKQLSSGYMTACDYSEFHERHTVEKNAEVSFGFEYLVQGLKTGKCYDLTHKVIHPPLAPSDKGTITTQQRTFKVCGNERNQGMYFDDYLWSFDEEWEKEAGEWTLYLMHDDRVLIQVEFIVY